MLEKQKTWCYEKVEKGKIWFEDHKFIIGLVSGTVVVTVGGILSTNLLKKIFKLEIEKFQVYYLNPDDPGDFAVSPVGKDRFGKEHIMNVTYLRAEDRDILVKNIDDAIAATKEMREKLKG